MKSLEVILLFTILCLCACAHQEPRFPSSLAGLIYPLRGLHNDLGTYEGELEIRPTGNKTFQVTRIVTYDYFRFDERRVQEIWQGEGTEENNILNVHFHLKQAENLNYADGFTRSPEQFSQLIDVLYTADFHIGISQIQIANENRNEQIRRDSRDAGAKPLWQSERQRIDYKKLKQAAIFDPTDFNFLRSNPDIIRLDNKVLDSISLLESTMRRDAYAPSLAEKARIFDQQIEEDHLDSSSRYVIASLNSEGRRIGFLTSENSGLMMGMYAGSQAMRWKVTKKETALKNFKRVTAALLPLLDTPHLSQENSTGLLYAFAWAYEILPAGDPLLVKIQDLAPNFTRDFSEFHGQRSSEKELHLYTLLRIAQILVAQKPDKKMAAAYSQKILEQFKKNLRQMEAEKATAHRAYLSVAARVFAAEDKPLNNSVLTPNLAQAVWTLREIPAQSFSHSTSYDLGLRTESSGRSPASPTDYAVSEYPLFEGRANECDNYWHSDFAKQGTASALIRHGRVDYLNVYWMGRLGGLLKNDD